MTNAVTTDICDLLPMVRYLARRLHPRSNRHEFVEREDLVHDGVVGLLEAVQRYDPDACTALSTFAFPRIRGAMLDAISKAQRQRYLRSRSAVECSTRPIPNAEIDLLVLEYGAALRDAIEDLDDLQRFFIVGQIHGDSDRDRCAEVGLTYWQYRRRREKTLAQLRRHLEGRQSATTSPLRVPVGN